MRIATSVRIFAFCAVLAIASAAHARPEMVQPGSGMDCGSCHENPNQARQAPQPADMPRMVNTTGKFRMLFDVVSDKVHHVDLTEPLNEYSREHTRLAQKHSADLAKGAAAPAPSDQALKERHALLEKGIKAYRLIASLIPVLEVDLDRGQLKIGKFNGKPIVAGRPDSLLVAVKTATGPGGKYSITGKPGGAVKVVPSELNCYPGQQMYVLLDVRADKAGKRRAALRFTRQDAAEATDLAFDLEALPSGILDAAIFDSATGERVPARITVTAAGGRQFIPEGYDPEKPSGWDYAYGYFYGDGGAKVVVPAGKTRIGIERGFEYKVFAKDVKVPAKGVVKADCRLERWIDMVEKGWHSVDSHLHYLKYTWYEEGNYDFLDMKKRAEDINVAHILPLKHWYKNFHDLVDVTSDTYPPKPGWLEKYSKGRYVTTVGEEFRNDTFYGHLVLWNIDGLVEPVSTGWMGGPDSVDYPSNTQIADQTRAQGGYVSCAHDVVQETPVMAALGRLDLCDLHTPFSWYDLLNCGFRLPGEIGSDYPANKMGVARAYVYTGSPKIENKAFVKALMGGRTFISSGPAIFFEADGKIPGDTIKMKPNGKAVVHVKARAQWRDPLQHLDIIHNGIVLRRINPAEPNRTLEYDGDIEVPGKGWLAARCSVNDLDHWWIIPGVAHTSPIYLEDGTGPFINADSAQRMLTMAETTLKKAQAEGKFSSPKQKEEVTALFEKGIAYYKNLIEKASTKPAPAPRTPQKEARRRKI